MPERTQPHKLIETLGNLSQKTQEIKIPDFGTLHNFYNPLRGIDVRHLLDKDYYQGNFPRVTEVETLIVSPDFQKLRYVDPRLPSPVEDIGGESFWLQTISGIAKSDGSYSDTANGAQMRRDYLQLGLVPAAEKIPLFWPLFF